MSQTQSINQTLSGFDNCVLKEHWFILLMGLVKYVITAIAIPGTSNLVDFCLLELQAKVPFGTNRLLVKF